MSPLTEEQALARAADTPHEEGVLTKVEASKHGWYLNIGTASWLLSTEQLGNAAPPQKGDAAALYTRNWSTVRGLDLRGEPIFYRTEEELDREHEQWVSERKEHQKEEFEEKRDSLDAKFESLPEVFRRRIQWFRDHNPDFRWEYEAYEMSCCIDAVAIAEAMETPTGVRAFQKMPYKEQAKKVPDLFDGHSGNSFAMTVRLAWLYLENPLLVIAEHGAMVPLTGCDEYGCAHPRPDDVMEALAAGVED